MRRRNPSDSRNKGRSGLCYPWAYHYAWDHRPDAVLQHGLITMPFSSPPKRIWHGWVIHNGLVKDWQTMEAGDGGPKFGGKGYPVREWLDLYKPRMVEEYWGDELPEVFDHFGHYGPWHGPESVEVQQNPARPLPGQPPFDFSTRPAPSRRRSRPKARPATGNRRSVKVTARQGDYIEEALEESGLLLDGRDYVEVPTRLFRPSQTRMSLTVREAQAAYATLGESEDDWAERAASSTSIETEAQGDFAEAQALKCIIKAESRLADAFPEIERFPGR